MHCPPLPNLEYILSFRISRRLEPSAKHHSEQFAENTTMATDLASGLRASPFLRHNHTINIHHSQVKIDPFEEMERVKSTSTTKGTVRSYKHGRNELLVTRQLSYCVEVSDKLADPESYRPYRDQIRRYEGLDGRERNKHFEYLSEPSWVIYTDLGGVSVPLEIIESMRLAQGASLEEWDNRNVMVTDTVWSILEDYLKSTQARRESLHRVEEV